MNTSFKIMLGASLLVLTSCGNNSRTASNANAESTVVKEDTVVAGVMEKTTTADLDQMELIAKEVFSMVLPQGVSADDLESIVISKCTPRFIDALKRANDFDDGGIAWWALRTMEQEGPEPESYVLSITPGGDEAVLVTYSDMGHKATTRLEFIKEGDEYKVNSAIVTYNNEKRTIK